jgi:hypothetical protein
MVLLDALEENEPVRVGSQDGVAGLLGSQAPVRTRITIAPAGRAVRLVGQIGPDDRLIAPVMPRQHDPILDPATLGDLLGIP